MLVAAVVGVAGAVAVGRGAVVAVGRGVGVELGMVVGVIAGRNGGLKEAAAAEVGSSSVTPVRSTPPKRSSPSRKRDAGAQRVNRFLKGSLCSLQSRGSRPASCMLSMNQRTYSLALMPPSRTQALQG